MRRELGQLSLADGLVEGGAGRNRQLEKIAALVDWAAFERLLGDLEAAPVGQPSYGPLILFRCLLLAQWYGLSDPALAEALLGPALVPPLRRPRAGRPGARPLDLLALSHGAGRAPAASGCSPS